MTTRCPSPIHPPLRRRQRGAALVEALVAMLVVAFGVLGFIGLQARTAISSLEGYQRAQGMALVQDMAERITLNRTGAVKDYYLRDAVGVDAICTVPPAPAAGAVPGFASSAFDLANTDVCEWHALVRQAMGQPGAELARVRGCISATGNAGELLVSLVWQGVQRTATTPLTCGSSDATAFPDPSLRRGVSTVVRIGSLL